MRQGVEQRLNRLLLAMPLIVLLCFLLLTSGCSSLNFLQSEQTQPETTSASTQLEKPTTAPEPTPQTPEQLLRAQAESAWSNQNMLEAERLYGILSRSSLGEQERPLVFSRLAYSALENGNGLAAVLALEAWQDADPTVEDNPLWQQTWGRALILLAPTDAQQRANAAASNTAAPLSLRAQGADVLMLLAPETDKVRWMEALNSVYNAGSKADRATMERGLAVLLPSVPAETLHGMLQYSLADTDRLFPWSVLLLDQARREGFFKQGKAAPDGSALSRINASSYADNRLFADILTAKDIELAPSSPSAVELNSGCVVLALPLSGNYAQIGTRIAEGAKAGVADLAQRNVTVELSLIDTDKPLWLEELTRMSDMCPVVGGPLLPEVYAAAKAGGALTRQAFFTFLPSLEGNDEGSLAWRFFSAPQDQINAMLHVANALGIDNYGILAPDEPYGQRMATLFADAAGNNILKNMLYDPTNTTSWNEITRDFVGGGMVGQTPVSSAKFQAAFLPDVWDNSSVLIPYLFFHGEERLLLMGTTLWAQGLNGAQRIDVSNAGLAVFPSAWNPHSTSGVALSLQRRLSALGTNEADLWTGVGYDFVRFASALNLQPNWNAALVNQRIQEAQNMDWSMAPLRWSPSGAAQQDLYIFSPTAEGFVETNLTTLQQKLEQARESYTRRVKTTQ